MGLFVKVAPLLDGVRRIGRPELLKHLFLGEVTVLAGELENLCGGVVLGFRLFPDLDGTLRHGTALHWGARRQGHKKTSRRKKDACVAGLNGLARYFMN
jgi:hypothetical protein